MSTIHLRPKKAFLITIGIGVISLLFWQSGFILPRASVLLAQENATPQPAQDAPSPGATAVAPPGGGPGNGQPPGNGEFPPGTGFPGSGRRPAAAADATLTPSAPPAPAAAFTPSASAIDALANLNGVNVLLADGSVRRYPLAESMTVVARNADTSLLYVEIDGERGWALREQVIAFGLTRLPVQESVAPVDTTRLEIDPMSEEKSAATTGTEMPASDSEGIRQEPPLTATLSLTETLRLTDTMPLPPAENPPPAAADNMTGDVTTNPTGVTATVQLTGSRLNVRSGPGADFTIIAKAYSQEEFSALARDATGAWIKVALDNSQFGWVAAEYLTLDHPLEELPLAADESNAQPYQESSSSLQTVAAPVTTAAATTTYTAAAAGVSGTLVFQSKPGGMIYAYTPQSGALRALTAGFDPAVSPDGGTVAFTRDGGENGIYLISIDGGNERRIFAERTRLSSPKWSPDGAWILFTRGDEYNECYDMGRNMCIPPSEFKLRFPDGAPEGMEFPLVKQYQYHLAAVDRDGGQYHDLPGLSSARAGDWNEAGIVYQSSSGLQITQDGDESANYEVAFDYLKPFYHDPDWQPDGGQIAFQMKEGSHWEIYVINPDGSGMTALTHPTTTLAGELPSNVAPAYSPDGEQIVFLSNRAAGGSTGPWRIWIMDADGSNQHPLDLNISLDYTFGDDQSVSWGP